MNLATFSLVWQAEDLRADLEVFDKTVSIGFLMLQSVVLPRFK